MAQIKYFLSTLLLAFVATSTNAISKSDNDALLAAAQADPISGFTAWAKLHNKPYHANSNSLEFQRKFDAWRSNLDFAVQHNAGRSSYWLTLTPLADLTREEYKKFLGYRKDAKPLHSTGKLEGFMYEDVDVKSLPWSRDWRKKGAVTDVKDQQKCGACWAFSAVGAIEGAHAIATGKLVSLSEQELIDCTFDPAADFGCDGPSYLTDWGFEFVLENGGIDSEDDYRYRAKDENCRKKKLQKVAATIDGYQDVPAYNEEALLQAVAHQPISAAIEADSTAIQLYGGGIFDDVSCGDIPDQSVVVVGYGRHWFHGKYWIVKNSWGTQWGDRGYIMMKYGVGMEGICGITLAASYPIVSKSAVKSTAAPF